jgi:rhamnose transport system ATP-binding protein
MAPAKPALVFRQIRKSFGAVRALRGVDFDVRAGEVHALLGENGAGKSTLIKVAAGAHCPDEGEIVIGGEVYRGLDPVTARQKGIACIYQQPALFPDLTVAENVGLRLEPAKAWRRVNWRRRRERATELLARVGAEITPEREVRSLSMPEQQLVEIACALGVGARVMIMDEPTASLTQREQERLFGIVRALRSEGAAVVYISHRLEEIFALADRVTVLRDGQSVGTNTVGEIDEAKLIRLMVGREITQLYPEKLTQRPADKGSFEPAHSSVEEGSSRTRSRPPQRAEDASDLTLRRAAAGSEPLPISKSRTALALRGLCCTESGVRDIEFEVQAGEIFGLAGLVGAGRTELARVLFGLTPADRGDVLVAGEPATLSSPRDAMDWGIAYVPEDRRRHGVILELPVAQNITLAIHPRIFRGGWLRFGRERTLAQEFVGKLGIKTADTAEPAGNLSGGNQQKVALARWLATKPKVLILDEPTQGVDVGAKSEIHRLVRELAAEGLAVILISSDLPEVIGMSDRIGVMRGGRLITILPGKSAPENVMAAALGKTHES